jgi:hypothetical protein
MEMQPELQEKLNKMTSSALKIAFLSGYVSGIKFAIAKSTNSFDQLRLIDHIEAILLEEGTKL